MVPETLESAPVCPAAPHSVERRKGRDGAAPQGSREAQERVPRCPASVGSQEKQKCRSVLTIQMTPGDTEGGEFEQGKEQRGH